MEHFFTGTGQYVASPELMSAVNVAITLEKPLLIKGEPGTGKTLLAQAVAAWRRSASPGRSPLPVCW